MNRSDIKVTARYVVLALIMYMAWFVIQPGYAQSIKDVGEVAVAAIYGSVFGALTLVLKANWETKVEKD